MMPNPATLLGLPTELQQSIVQFLGGLSHVQLQMSCQYYFEVIPHRQVLELDVSEFAIERDLYACWDCLPLLPRKQFADQIVKKKRDKFGYDNENDSLSIVVSIMSRYLNPWGSMLGRMAKSRVVMQETCQKLRSVKTIWSESERLTVRSCC